MFYASIPRYNTIPDTSYLQQYNLLFSANSWYLNNKLKVPNYIPKTDIICDSGGFSFHKKFGEFPITMEEYITWVIQIGADKAIMWDKMGDSETTWKYTRDLETYSVPFQWLPVVQGNTLEEYLKSYNRVKHYPYIALGNLKNLDLKILYKILQFDNKFHLLGCGLKLLKTLATGMEFKNITFDSASWNYRFGSSIPFDDYRRKHLDMTQVEYGIKIKLPEYYEKVENIIGYWKSIKPLF